MPKTFTAPLAPKDAVSAPAASQPVLLHQGPTALLQWLDVSWFYPPGFTKDLTLETPTSWLALGNGIAYKFFKLHQSLIDSGNQEAFQQRWRLACEEIIDHRELAADVYMGLRLLRWVDDEPQWMSEKVARSLDPARAPASANDVAVVMRRIPEQHFLYNRLAEPNFKTDTALDKLSARLKEFHTQSIGKSLVTFRDEPSLLHAILFERYQKPLNDFILSYGSFLDPFSQIAFEELRGFITSFLEKNAHLFSARLKEGAFMDCHGALNSEHIAIDDQGELAVFGRVSRNSPERFADFLCDIASLVLDLEARGFTTFAQQFEDKYFPLPSHENELYRFYKVAEASRRAQQFFEDKVDDPFNLGTACLSYALRIALRIDKPFLVVISSKDAKEAEQLGRSLEALTSGVLNPNAVEKKPFGKYFPASPGLDRLLQHIELERAKGESIIVQWPLNREEERLVIQRFAVEHEMTLLFVTLDSDEGGKAPSPRRLRSLQSDLSQYLNELSTHHLIIQPSLPRPDLALLVLRALGQVSRAVPL